jgi:hypothetical protein
MAHCVFSWTFLATMAGLPVETTATVQKLPEN